jgi:transposase
VAAPGTGLRSLAVGGGTAGDLDGTSFAAPWVAGLAALVRERFTLDPLSGHLFLFRNRRGDRIKILAWDRGGFWVLYKRLERGTFAWPVDDDVPRVELRSADLLLLLSGVDLAHTRRRRWYERVA